MNIYIADKPELLVDLAVWSALTGDENILMFPEINQGYPIHPREMLEKCKEWKDNFNIFSMSEYVVLWAQQQVRLKQSIISLFFIENSQSIKQMKLDAEGDFMDDYPSPYGFFNDRLPLLR